MKTKIKETKEFGRGVFATKDFRKGTIIEASPVILIPTIEYTHAISKTILVTYAFKWDDDYTAIALGNGSLFNHNVLANVTYEPEIKSKLIKFKALRAIKKGEQLFVNYGYNPEYGTRIYNEIINAYSKVSE